MGGGWGMSAIGRVMPNEQTLVGVAGRSLEIAFPFCGRAKYRFSHTADNSGATFIVREVSMSSSIHRLTGIALGAAFAVTLAAPASAQLIPRKDLSASM